MTAILPASRRGRPRRRTGSVRAIRPQAATNSTATRSATAPRPAPVIRPVPIRNNGMTDAAEQPSDREPASVHSASGPHQQRAERFERRSAERAADGEDANARTQLRSARRDQRPRQFTTERREQSARHPRRRRTRQQDRQKRRRQAQQRRPSGRTSSPVLPKLQNAPLREDVDHDRAEQPAARRRPPRADPAASAS